MDVLRELQNSKFVVYLFNLRICGDVQFAVLRNDACAGCWSGSADLLGWRRRLRREVFFLDRVDGDWATSLLRKIRPVSDLQLCDVVFLLSYLLQLRDGDDIRDRERGV